MQVLRPQVFARGHWPFTLRKSSAMFDGDRPLHILIAHLHCRAVLPDPQAGVAPRLNLLLDLFFWKFPLVSMESAWGHRACILAIFDSARFLNERFNSADIPFVRMDILGVTGVRELCERFCERLASCGKAHVAEGACFARHLWNMIGDELLAEER